MQTVIPTGRLAGIRVYPIKSLDALQLPSVAITPGGSLRYDREFAIIDADGGVVNAKRYERIHLIRTAYERDNPYHATFSAPGQAELKIDLDADDDRARLVQWLADFFGFAVELRRATHGGYPDDPKRPGPTVLSRASLQQISEWMPQFSVDELADRFRANLEIADVPAFWEDALIAEVKFKIGAVELIGMNPCARCVVPTRHPQSGALDKTFAKKLTDLRREHLPDWAPAEVFSHYYRLSTNTRIEAQFAGQRLSIDEAVTIV